MSGGGWLHTKPGMAMEATMSERGAEIQAERVSLLLQTESHSALLYAITSEVVFHVAIPWSFSSYLSSSMPADSTMSTLANR